MFDLSSITKSSYVSLRQLIDHTNNHLLALKAFNEQTDTWDTMIIHFLTIKLDHFSKREWEKHLLSIVGKPTFKDMIMFLESHCKYLQGTTVEKQEPAGTHHKGKQNLNPQSDNSKYSELLASDVTTERVCPLRGESHAIYNC